MRMIGIGFPLLASILLLGPITPRAQADESAPAPPEPATLPAERATVPTEKANLSWEKGSLSLGGFLTAFNSTLAFGANNLGVNVNAEDLLNLDSQLTVFRVGAVYRPGKSRRNQLDFTYAAYHRSGHTALTKEIEVGDVTFPVGASLDTVFNFDLIRGTYSYAILQDDRIRLALGLGVYAVPLRYSLNAQTTGGRVAVEAADTTLPLPALAMRADFLLVPRLYLMSSIDAMYLEIADFKGSLLDVNVALEYRPWKHLGLGLGYNGFSVDVEGKSSSSDYPGVDFVGSVGVRYGGLMFYGKFLF